MGFEFPFISISKAPGASSGSPSRGPLAVIRDVFRGQDSSGNIFSRSRRHDTWSGGAERQDYEDRLTDSDGQVESRERIELMKIGRRCFESIPHIKKAELLQARFCTPTSWESQVNDTPTALKISRYVNKRMEASYFDLSENSSLPEMIESASIDHGIDGDVFFNLVKPRDSEYSLIQPIRAHRVGDDKTGFQDVTAEIAERFGMRRSKPQKFREHSGVILDSRNRRRGIRVYPIKRNSFLEIDSGNEGKVIPFTQIFQLIKPLHTDRVREVSTWNTSLTYARDVQEIWRYLNATLKSQVSAPIVENNRTGKPPSRNAKPKSLNELSRDNNPGITDETPQLKKIVPGSVQYLRLGETITDFKAQRPNASFFDCMVHLYSTGAMARDMPYPMIFDSKGYGGANLRFEIDQGGASLKSARGMRQKRFLDPWVRAIILEGIRNGELDLPASRLSELSVGTWYWPELPVADQKYNAKVTQDNYEFGFCSGNDVTKPKGRSFIEIQRERGAEYEEKLLIAKDIHGRHPERPLGEILDALGKPVNPNGSAIWEGIISDQSTAGENDSKGNNKKPKPAAVKTSDTKAIAALAAVEDLETRVDDLDAQNAELLEKCEQFEQMELFAEHSS